MATRRGYLYSLAPANLSCCRTRVSARRGGARPLFVRVRLQKPSPAACCLGSLRCDCSFLVFFFQFSLEKWGFSASASPILTPMFGKEILEYK